MKKLILSLLFALLAVSAGAQVSSTCGGQPCTPITNSGGTIIVPNNYGGMNATFEEIIAGAPASSTITIQGCMRANTCDTAFDTNSGNTATAIRSITPTAKPYSYFLVTFTFSGGTNVSLQVNPFITTAARNASSSSVVGTVTLPTTGVTSGACDAAPTTFAASGATTASRIISSPTVNPNTVSGYGASASGSLYIYSYPTTNTANFVRCNNTSGTITPAALTLNVEVH